MRVLISSVGTRGDVQPALALAQRLRDLGCEARLCVPPNFVAWAQGLGFAARPLGVEMRAPRPGVAPPPVPDLITDQFETLQAAAEGCDAVVGAGVHQYAARSVAERNGARYLIAAYAPVSLPSADLAPAGRAVAQQEPAEIQRRWQAARRGWNDRSLGRVNLNRGRLGLAPVDDLLDHILGARPLLACDAWLGPAPRAADVEVVQTGAWLLPDTAALPPALDAFLAAGEAPVYLGFGSMPAPYETNLALVEAVRAVGRRMVLSAGWAGFARIDDAPDGLVIEDVNHQALFPRVAAVVHHGGAGTTTAAALAGAPQVVAPLFSDQFYWASRVAELGLGAVAPSALDSYELARALDAALRPAVTARASAAAGQVSTTGADTAARIVVEGGRSA
ncbi:glycosyltransferase [Caulobacter sp. KR2-114]|uniref:glycosyltransferase n=1 Tax=Caulobacter sp. KR2-114 TaxID=3400912 RepID=UPI003C0839B8